MNNLSDASSNIVSVLGFKLASKPADPEHPYGHGRYEYLSGLVVAALVLLIGVELVKSSVERVIHPEPVEFSLALVAVLVLSMVVKLWMATLNQKLGDRIESETLHATAQDSKNDVLATGAVLACAIVSQVTHINLDAWVGLAVGAYIGWSGFELIQDTVSPLLGQTPDPKLVKHIRDKIMSYPGVLGVHDLMVHDYGPGRKFASAHAEMAAEASPLESHDTLDNIEQAFRNEDGMIVTLHYDPIVTDDPKVASMRLRINAMAQQIDNRLSIHDLRCVPGPTHTNVIFDCVRPSDLQMSAEDVKHALAQRRIGISQVDCQDYDRRRLRRPYPRVGRAGKASYAEGESMKRLYLLRHGQTEFNVKKLVQGRCDSPLTGLGRQQARVAAACSKPTTSFPTKWSLRLGPSHGHSSARCYRTPRSGRRCRALRRIIERCYGTFEEVPTMPSPPTSGIRARTWSPSEEKEAARCKSAWWTPSPISWAPMVSKPS